MSAVGDFVDPVAALASRELSARAGLPPVAAAATHASTIQIWIDKARAVVLPAIRSFLFSDGDLQAIHEAYEITIDDKMTHQRALELLKALQCTRRDATKYYEDMRRPYRGVAEAVIDLEKRDVVPVDEAERALEVKIKAYDAAEQAREEQERQRLQAIKDQEAADARARAAEAMARVAEQHPEPDVRAAIQQEAAAIAAAPIATTRVSVPSQRAYVSGARLRADRWAGELVDGTLKGKIKLLRAILKNEIPMDAIGINQTWIDAKAREHKDQLGNVYPLLRAVKNPPQK